MNKKKIVIFSSAICLMLVVAIILTTTMCGKNSAKPTDNTKKPSTESDTSVVTSETSDLVIEESVQEDGFTEDTFIDFNTEFGYDDDIDFFEQNEDEISDVEDGDWELEDISYDKYKSIIQCYGSEASGNKRNINIDVDYIVHKDFLGFGTNIFPAGLSVSKDIGYNEVFFEFDMTREKYMKPSVARMMYQVDWMTTDEEPEPRRTDIENNKDYKNYLNGIYDFETVELKSIYTYLDKYKEFGTEIELNFGWKTNYDITNWFSLPVSDPQASAPRNVKAYAKACVAAIKNLHDRGYKDVVKYLSFFNEPNHKTGDFITVGASEYWYIKTTLAVCEALEDAGIRNDIEVWGPEQGQATINYHNYLLEYSKDKEILDNIDNLSLHRYFKPSFDNNYYELFHDIVYFNNEFKKRVAITEMVAAGTAIGFLSDSNKIFEDSYTAYIIASANAGARCALSWGFSEGWCVAPLNFWQGAYALTATKNKVSNATSVDPSYKECAIITNYCDKHSDVLMSKWDGDDIKLTTLRLPDGNYTILLETDNSKNDYEISINFSKEINKTFYRISHNRLSSNNIDYTIPSTDKTFENIGKKLDDTLSKGASMYIYTTKAPLKQIRLDNYALTIKKNDTATLTPELIDCEGDIEWSISASVGKKGTISENGVYTPSSDANSGDCVAIRAALKSDPNIYTTAMIGIE